MYIEDIKIEMHVLLNSNSSTSPSFPLSYFLWCHFAHANKPLHTNLGVLSVLHYVDLL